MYRVVFCIVLVATVLGATDEEMVQKCAPLMHPKTLACCTKSRAKEMDMMDFSECFDLPMNPVTCEFDTCVAKMVGIANADGALDIKSVQRFTEKNLADEPEVAGAIISHCVNGDIQKYGPKDFCDIVKMRNCIQVQFIEKCPEFSSEGDCSTTKALVEECTKAFA